MIFDSSVWGPHYWFFLHTVAESYPSTPTAVTKRKYYDLIQNFPLFIPVPEMGNRFSKLLDEYPVTPYLGSKESFVKWVHFIHNRMNLFLGKKEVSLYQSLEIYRNEYKPKTFVAVPYISISKQTMMTIVILACMGFIFYYIDTI
jgi:hypothetical protein